MRASSTSRPIGRRLFVRSVLPSAVVLILFALMVQHGAYGQSTNAASAPLQVAALSSSEASPAAALDAALRAYRDFSAMSGDVLLEIIPIDSRASITRALNLDLNSAASAWALFFKGALWIPSSTSDDSAAVAFYNPAFDVALLTQWRRTDQRWSIVSVQPRTGASIRREPDGAEPAWVLSRSVPISAGLLAQQLPTVEQIEAAGTTPANGREALLPLARIVGMRSAVERALRSNVSLLQSVLSIVQKGDASALRRAGSSAADATAISRLPAPFRTNLAVFGAVPYAWGAVLVMGPEHSPGLVYLVALDKRGAVTGISAVAELNNVRLAPVKGAS